MIALRRTPDPLGAPSHTGRTIRGKRADRVRDIPSLRPGVPRSPGSRLAPPASSPSSGCRRGSYGTGSTLDRGPVHSSSTCSLHAPNTSHTSPSSPAASASNPPRSVPIDGQCSRPAPTPPGISPPRRTARRPCGGPLAAPSVERSCSNWDIDITAGQWRVSPIPNRTDMHNASPDTPERVSEYPQDRSKGNARLCQPPEGNSSTST